MLRHSDRKKRVKDRKREVRGSGLWLILKGHALGPSIVTIIVSNVQRANEM